jgi:hypothetical protein
MATDPFSLTQNPLTIFFPIMFLAPFPQTQKNSTKTHLENYNYELLKLEGIYVTSL